MGYEQPLMKVGMLPSNDDRHLKVSNQFFGVMIGTATNGVLGAGQGNAAVVYPQAGGRIIGVLQNNPLQGEACELTCEGITKVKATGEFSVGDLLAVDAQGGFVKADGSATPVAIAWEQAAVGDVSTAKLI